jgi:hypothetical protein
MTAPRRLLRVDTDQLKTLDAEVRLFEDRLRNAKYTSRPARFLLAVAAFFAFRVRLGRSAAYRWRSR